MQPIEENNPCINCGKDECNCFPEQKVGIEICPNCKQGKPIGLNCSCWIIEKGYKMSGINDNGIMRQFGTGATRNSDEGKNDYEGFLSPSVIERFGEYMTKHRKQADGQLRDSDNWQKGIPRTAYIKSNWRHFMDLWKEHRGIATKDGIEEALCAIMFNTMGYLHEYLKEKNKDITL